MQITAGFFVYFVFDGIIKENSIELLAAMVLDALVLARVIYFMTEKGRSNNSTALPLLGCIVLGQLIVMVSVAALQSAVFFAGSLCSQVWPDC